MTKNNEKKRKKYLFWFSFYSLFGAVIEQAVKTKPKQVFFFNFSSFLTVYLLFQCRFVAW